METSDTHQRLVVKDLEEANKENVALKEHVREVNSRVSDLTEEVETIRKDVKSTSSEAEKHYIANFYLMEAYQSFAKC